MKTFLTNFFSNGIREIPLEHQAEFWREIHFTNVRRVRSLLLISIPGFSILLYLVHIRNILNLQSADRFIILQMQVVIFSILITFALLFFARPMRSPKDSTHYFIVLMRFFVVIVVLTTQTFVYVVLKTNGHPVFFYQIIMTWASALLFTPRGAVLLGFVMLGMFLTISELFSLGLENIRFNTEAYVSSAAITVISVLSNTILFRNRVQFFCQRKNTEGERNTIVLLNHELERRQKILEQQATDIEIFNTQLQEQNQKLFDVNNEKNELMNIVSHDLKNPIAGVRGLAELMQADFISTEQKPEIYEQIIQISDRMLGMVTNFLDVNRLEEGAMQFQTVNIDIVPLVENAIRQFSKQAEAKNITLQYSAESVSNLVIADEQATVQVLDNIISNAIKYSPHGKSVFVRVKASNETVRVEVQDEGPGISSDDMKKLFGKFARLSAQPTGGEHSTGLGLSIVKKMVEAMNGKVWCESELGKGATFIVELPKKPIILTPIMQSKEY